MKGTTTLNKIMDLFWFEHYWKYNVWSVCTHFDAEMLHILPLNDVSTV